VFLQVTNLLHLHFISSSRFSYSPTSLFSHTADLNCVLFSSDIHSQTLFNFNVWLTVHRSSVWIKKPTRCHLVLYLFLLYKLLFISCSTCFRPPCAHLKERTTWWYFFTCGVVPWLCRQSDPVGWLCVHWEVRSMFCFLNPH